jgi:hypothetical protein
MIILWVRKKKKEEKKRSLNNDRDSFQEHDALMKKFRFSHPDPDIKITAYKNILTTDGNLLAPVYKVKIGENTQN